MSPKCIIDPKLFLSDAVDTETEQFNSRLESVLAKMPPTHKMTPQEVRAERDSEKSMWGPVKRSKKAKDRVIKGKTCDVSVRIVIPDKVNGIISICMEGVLF